jgi:dUTP pyrophosphatase
MEMNNLKRSIHDFVKNIESLVERSLGDRSQIEEQLRTMAKTLEKSVTDVVWNKKSTFERATVRVQKLDHFKGDLPQYQTPHSAGFDVRAQLAQSLILKPGERVLVPTGLSFEIPHGFEIQVRARSGWAIKSGMGLVNAPGTIDADYRGEVKVILINWGEEPVTINDQDRIAQMVLCPVIQAELLLTDMLSASERGEGGFGSTGKQ